MPSRYGSCNNPALFVLFHHPGISGPLGQAIGHPWNLPISRETSIVSTPYLIEQRLHSYSMYRETRCPACGEEADQEILSESRDLLIRCIRCGHVWHMEKERLPKPLFVKAIVSKEGESRICQIEFLPGDSCSVGDRLVAECGDDVSGVEVASIEAGPRRLERAKVEEITTLWTREIEEVIVRVSVHDGWKTIPVTMECNGEEPFIVGEVYKAGGRRFKIAHIKLRTGAVLRKEGWKTVASKIKRVYAYPA
jgi:uncharacterized Zn finger protein